MALGLQVESRFQNCGRVGSSHQGDKDQLPSCIRGPLRKTRTDILAGPVVVRPEVMVLN